MAQRSCHLKCSLGLGSQHADGFYVTEFLWRHCSAKCIGYGNTGAASVFIFLLGCYGKQMYTSGSCCERGWVQPGKKTALIKVERLKSQKEGKKVGVCMFKFKQWHALSWCLFLKVVMMEKMCLELRRISRLLGECFLLSSHTLSLLCLSLDSWSSFRKQTANPSGLQTQQFKHI